MDTIIKDIITTSYRYFGCAFVFSILCSIVVQYCEKVGFKILIKEWLFAIRNCSQFRKRIFFFFYTMIVLLTTVMNRDIFINPLQSVMGDWYFEKNGSIKIDNIENILLFIPWSILFMMNFLNVLLIKKNLFICFFETLGICFVFSTLIEVTQLIFHIGTFQLIDIFCNTTGGFIGELIFIIVYFFKKLIYSICNKKINK